MIDFWGWNSQSVKKKKMTRKREKRVIKIRSWKESLEKMAKAKGNENGVVSEVLSRGRGSQIQPPLDTLI